MRDPTPTQFLNDVVNHKLEILHEHGLYRHLRFQQQPKHWNMWFDLITWPGCLTIKGDMGCWTFSRVDDMLTLFRSGKLEINADYWAEKLQHGTHGGRSGAKVWDEGVFKRHLAEQLTDYYSLEGEDLATVARALKEEVLNQDNKYELLIAARDFTCDLDPPPPETKYDRLGLSAFNPPRERRKFEFDSCELPDGMKYAYHFIWCLYAIVWGIQQYDAVKVEVAVA